MLSRVVLLALVISGAAAAEEVSSRADPPRSADASGQPSLLPGETFRLFPSDAPAPRLDLSGAPDGKRLFHLQGDPDSTLTLGKPSPDGEVRLLAVIDVNEIFLKAIPPDPLIQSGDTRPRAAGSFLPVDNQGRPYQLRLGARLVW